jgi:hypothetical protein
MKGVALLTRREWMGQMAFGTTALYLGSRQPEGKPRVALIPKNHFDSCFRRAVKTNSASVTVIRTVPASSVKRMRTDGAPAG